MEDNKKYDAVQEELETRNQKEEEASFDIKTIFTLVVLNWQWFLLSMFIFVCGSLIYLRYADSVYQVSAKMLIKEEQQNRGRAGQMLANMQDLGFMSNSAGIDNEIEILKSRILALEAVKDLKLYVEYRKEGKIKKSLVYKYQPISVDLDADHLKAFEKRRGSLQFKLFKKGDEYVAEGADFRGTFKTLPAALKTPYGTLTFTKNMVYEQALAEARLGMSEEEAAQLKDSFNDTYYITIISLTAVASHYASAISIEPTSKLTSIALLSLKDNSPERAFDYLKQLAICYNRQANADKNEIAYKTEEFINSRLEKITAELGATESELESYKRNNNLVQMRIDATQTMTQANQYYGQLMQANTQLQILDELRRHIDNPANRYQIIPSNVGLSDGASSALISQYNKTVLDRNRLLAAASENSPLVMAQTSQLDQLEVSIKEALRQARRTADIQQQSIERQYSEFQSRIANTPEQERVLTQIGRQQEIKSGLYLMLLQKRESNNNKVTKLGYISMESLRKQLM